VSSYCDVVYLPVTHDSGEKRRVATAEPGKMMKLCAAMALASCAAAAAARNATLPHIVMLMVDDFGWANVGFHAKGQPNEGEVITPNMDQLAAEGIILDRHYAFRFCSPSRSSFLTGRNPIHVNVGNGE